VPALEQFVSDAGGGPIFIIAWASGEPDQTSASLAKELAELGATLQISLVPPRDEAEATDWLERLAMSGGVFFTGGDQSKLTQGFQGEIGSKLLEALKEKFTDQFPFAGTSAGSAAMSEVMITNTSTEPAAGLGLQPGLTIDTHFFQRDRKDRLLGLLESLPEQMGLGIDSGSAIKIEGFVKLVNLGPKESFVVFRPTQDGKRETLTLGPQKSIELDLKRSQQDCEELLKAFGE